MYIRLPLMRSLKIDKIEEEAVARAKKIFFYSKTNPISLLRARFHSKYFHLSNIQYFVLFAYYTYNNTTPKGNAAAAAAAQPATYLKAASMRCVFILYYFTKYIKEDTRINAG